jgi:hypothetical protein
MSKGHRPHQNFPQAGAARPERRPGGCHNPARAPCSPGTTPQQDHPLPLRGVPRRWHRRCPADRHRQRWSDDRRIPPPGAPCTAVLGDPRPAPDAFSAGTRRLGRGCSRRTAPPHHFVVCSVATFSRSQLAVPITEPVTRYATEQRCHMVTRSTRSGTAAVQDGWSSGTSAL